VSAAGPAGLDVVDRAIGVAEASNRRDLAQRLAHTRRRLLDPTVRVLVVGEFKQGKSLLVNALIDAPVCPVDDDIATAVPTEVSYSKTPIATLVRGTGNAADAETTRVQVPIGKLASHVSEAGNPANRHGVLRAEVGVPRQILAGGLTHPGCAADRRRRAAGVGCLSGVLRARD
jgi:hypothetical protein